MLLHFYRLLGNSLQPELFCEFVELKLKERKRKLLRSNNLLVNIDSRVSRIFEESQMVSGTC